MHKPGKMVGLLLLLFGGVLLTQNLGLINIDWSMLWPAIPLFYGLYLYFRFYQDRDKEALIYATLFTGIGILCFIPPYDLSWEDTIKWWPVCPLFWGLGSLFAYLTDRKDTRLLLSSTILMVIGGFFLASNFKWAQIYLKYWPVILIVFGIVFFWSNPIHRNQKPI